MNATTSTGTSPEAGRVLARVTAQALGRIAESVGTVGPTDSLSFAGRRERIALPEGIA
jgi:hypothetical protein